MEFYSFVAASDSTKELQEYIEEDENLSITLLEQEPIYMYIAQVAATGNTGIISSCRKTGLFSVAGKVFRPERCRLKDETFYRLMFVRCNNRYLKQVRQ